MRVLLGGLLLVAVIAARSQPGSTFAYTGDDAVRDLLNTHNLNYGGFTNSFALQDQEVVAPWLPALYYEHGYLLWPTNKGINVAVNIAPEIFLNIFFMGRVTATADLMLLNEASNKPLPGVGLRVGAGYSMLGSSFGFSENTPIVRAGVLFGNIRLTYAYSLGRTTIIDHQVGVCIKFDW